MPSFKELIWGPEVPAAEKKLLRKLDFVILTFCCFSFFFNYLDRGAFANAYVSGLSTSLKLAGNEYNILLAMTTAGYCIGQMPHGIVIQVVAPRIWFPSMILLWAGLTMCSAACKTYAQLCVVRFFQGLIEASTYCGTLYIIGSWYKPNEIAKRTGIFTASGQMGTLFAGVMMTAIKAGLDGHGGLPGWKWVFIIDGIITLPIAIMGFLYFPDTPEKVKINWLTPEEKLLALDRLPPKRKDAHNIEFWSLSKRVFFSPSFWILCLFSAMCGALEAFCVQGLMLLWMKYYKYASALNTTWPLGITAVGIVSNLSAAVFIDATGKRFLLGFLACGLQLISAIILLIRSSPSGAQIFAFYLAGTSYIINPLLFGWASVILQRGGDDALRSVTLGGMNSASSILYTFWGIALYSAADAPYWKKGAIAMICIIVVVCGLLFLVQWLDNYTLKMEEERVANLVTEIGEDAASQIEKEDAEKAPPATMIVPVV